MHEITFSVDSKKIHLSMEEALNYLMIHGFSQQLAVKIMEGNRFHRYNQGYLKSHLDDFIHQVMYLNGSDYENTKLYPIELRDIEDIFNLKFHSVETAAIYLNLLPQDVQKLIKRDLIQFSIYQGQKIITRDVLDRIKKTKIYNEILNSRQRQIENALYKSEKKIENKQQVNVD